MAEKRKLPDPLRPGKKYLQKTLTLVYGLDNINTATLSQDERRAIAALDYYTWQEGIPKEFKRDLTFDSLPGDPVARLFDSLPPIMLDDAGVSAVGRDSDSSAIEYDRKFANALWPFANSDIKNLLHSPDPMIIGLWQAARAAFAVYEQKNNNTIRNAFMQSLAAFRDDLPATSSGLDQANRDDRGNVVVSSKVKWITYCSWIAAGRVDHVSPIPDRLLTKETMSINLTSHRNVCSFCGARPFEGQPVRGPAPRIIKCGGCFVDELPNISQQYCDCTCSKKDWKDNHYYACRQRCGFLRSAYLLRNMVDIFMKASYSGMSSEHIQEYNDFVSAALKPDGPLDSTGPNRISSHDCAAEEPWVGESVFPKKYLDKFDDSPAWAARLAQDAGDDYLRHLHGIIIDTLHAHCSQVVEMYVYVRNAGTVLHLGSDYHPETGQITVNRGKNPMFWPHPVLYCKLKPVGPKGQTQEWIIDLHCAKYGWTEYVLPFDAFVKTRMASSHIATAFKDAPMHWCPWEEKGRRRARYHLGHYIHNAIIKFMEDKAKLKVPFELTRLKDVSEWKRLSKGFLDVFRTAAFAGAEKIRQSGTHRQFIYYQHNSYGPEYGLGVTNDLHEICFFQPVWLSPDQWARDYIELSKMLETDSSPGTFTRYTLCRWIARLKYRADHHEAARSRDPSINAFDYDSILGSMAKYFSIGENLTLEDSRAILKAHFTREGVVTAADIDQAVDNEIKKGVLFNKTVASDLLAGPSAQVLSKEALATLDVSLEDAEEQGADDDRGAAQRAKKNKKKKEKKKAKKAAAKAEAEAEADADAEE